MIGNLNHVAIAVPDLDAGIRKYRDMLGALKFLRRRTCLNMV